MSAWIGVDLDGTLAHYEGWNGPGIGKPIPRMVDRVLKHLRKGDRVKIFTARVTVDDPKLLDEQVELINLWCLEHLNTVLEITATKDLHMIMLYDDRCVQMVPNEGITIEESLRNFYGE